MYIFVDSGTGMLAVGISGGLTDKKCEARTFMDKLDAILYIEKHGLEKLATIRRLSNCTE